ncbi:MAG: CbiX/SirB N-terminal domain-containing protein [Aggregatilineales bacterium]
MTVRTALVLAGHGSHISPETAGLVWRQVDTLRRAGVADEVTAAFWKEAPAFHDVFRTLMADDITVVPMFTARGYFTQTVIPAEMGLTGSVTYRDGRIIRYARTLGEHPAMADLVKRRVTEWLSTVGAGTPPEQAAVAIIGHSTRLNPESRLATEAQAALLRAANLVAEVVGVYLDDTPEIAEVYRMTNAPIVIAVPYFLASGSHVSIDVPARLGLPRGQTVGQIQGRTVYYMPPIGADESLIDLIRDQARQVGLPFRKSYDSPKSWRGVPQAGSQMLNEAVRKAERFVLGELELTTSEIHRVDDLTPKVAISDPSELRAVGRGTWNAAPFRPLPTARNLPGGWRVPVNEPEQLHTVVETIYPGAVADWAAYQVGTLIVESLEMVTARQTGQFRVLKDLSVPEQSNVVESVCGQCVRHPTWHVGESPSDAIPCAAPCNWWMSHALKVVESRKMETIHA